MTAKKKTDESLDKLVKYEVVRRLTVADLVDLVGGRAALDDEKVLYANTILSFLDDNKKSSFEAMTICLSVIIMILDECLRMQGDDAYNQTVDEFLRKRKARHC